MNKTNMTQFQELETLFQELVTQREKIEAATAEAQSGAALNSASQLYQTRMGRLLNGTDINLEERVLLAEHNAALEASIGHFNGQHGICGEESLQLYVTRLTQVDPIVVETLLVLTMRFSGAGQNVSRLRCPQQGGETFR